MKGFLPALVCLLARGTLQAQKNTFAMEPQSPSIIGLPFNIEFPAFRFSMGGTVGFQCIFGQRWYWNVRIGPGFNCYDSRFHWSGAGDLGLGIILNKM